VGNYSDYISLNEPCNFKQILNAEILSDYSAWLQKLFAEDERFYNILCCVDPREIDYMWKNPDTENHLRSIVYAMKKSPTPVFVWLHLLETHAPFNYPRHFNRYSGQQLKELEKYDNSVLYFDYLFKELSEQLQKEKLDENTIIILSSSRGGRHLPQEVYPSFTYTAFRFADSAFHIPLIIKFPGQQKGKVFENFTSSLDLRPTILDYLGIKDVSVGDGESLMPLMKGEVNSTGVKASVSQVFILSPENRDPGFTYACEDVVDVWWKKYVILLHKQLLKSTPLWSVTYQSAIETNDNNPYPCVLFKEPNLEKGQVTDVEPISYKGFQCIGIYDVSKGLKSKTNLLHEEEGKKVLEEINTEKLDDLLRIPSSRTIR
jgi:arylsulfatase A-like enzyme